MLGVQKERVILQKAVNAWLMVKDVRQTVKIAIKLFLIFFSFYYFGHILCSIEII